MKKLLITLALLLASFSLFAEGGKNQNPITSVEVGEDCVYVFVGDNNEQCEDAISPDQSQQAYMCNILKLCPK